MGLFSKLFKNKQDTAGKDSGYYSSSDDQAAGERARSKRASSAEGAKRARTATKESDDPVLPEKKRARRRLVGAIALALLVAIGLPMVLDSEPKPLASDIDIKIPSKDKPAEPVASASSRVAASAALDNSEEILAEAPKAAAKPAAPAVAAVAPSPVAAKPSPAIVAPVVAELKVGSEAAKPTPKDTAEAEAKAEAKAKAVAEAKLKADARAEAEAKAKAKAEADAKLAKLEHKTEAKPEHAKPDGKLADSKPAAKPTPKDEAKPADDASRALAILEGKAAAKPAAESSAAGQKFVVRVAALATHEKVDQLQEKLKEAGIHSFTQKVPTPSGELTRVSVGPFANKEEAEKVRAKLAKLGLNGSLVPQS